MTDAEFLAAFEGATLPRSEWTHAAHLRMAYLYLRDDPAGSDAVLPLIRERIQCFNLAHRNRTGYHETITAAFVRLVAYRLRQEAGTSDFDAFRVANPDLFAPDLGGLAPYYTRATLISPDARAGFVPPDREPLP